MTEVISLLALVLSVIALLLSVKNYFNFKMVLDNQVKLAFNNTLITDSMKDLVETNLNFLKTLKESNKKKKNTKTK